MRRILIFSVVFIWAVVASAATTLTGTVTRVVDGDTVTFVPVLNGQRHQITIRLWGIDAPEKGQDYSKESADALAEMVTNRTVSVISMGKDRYTRTLGKIKADSVDVNLEMIHKGAAWHCSQYAPKESAFASAQMEAVAAKRGLWSLDNPIAPWNYRKATGRLSKKEKLETKIENMEENVRKKLQSKREKIAG